MHTLIRLLTYSQLLLSLFITEAQAEIFDLEDNQLKSFLNEHRTTLHRLIGLEYRQYQQTHPESGATLNEFFQALVYSSDYSNSLFRLSWQRNSWISEQNIYEFIQSQKNKKTILNAESINAEYNKFITDSQLQNGTKTVNFDSVNPPLEGRLTGEAANFAKKFHQPKLSTIEWVIDKLKQDSKWAIKIEEGQLRTIDSYIVADTFQAIDTIVTNGDTRHATVERQINEYFKKKSHREKGFWIINKKAFIEALFNPHPWFCGEKNLLCANIHTFENVANLWPCAYDLKQPGPYLAYFVNFFSDSRLTTLGRAYENKSMPQLAMASKSLCENMLLSTRNALRIDTTQVTQEMGERHFFRDLPIPTRTSRKVFDSVRRLVKKHFASGMNAADLAIFAEKILWQLHSEISLIEQIDLSQVKLESNSWLSETQVLAALLAIKDQKTLIDPLQSLFIIRDSLSRDRHVQIKVDTNKHITFAPISPANHKIYTGMKQWLEEEILCQLRRSSDNDQVFLVSDADDFEKIQEEETIKLLQDPLEVKDNFFWHHHPKVAKNWRQTIEKAKTVAMTKPGRLYFTKEILKKALFQENPGKFAKLYKVPPQGQSMPTTCSVASWESLFYDRIVLYDSRQSGNALRSIALGNQPANRYDPSKNLFRWMSYCWGTLMNLEDILGL